MKNHAPLALLLVAVPMLALGAGLTPVQPVPATKTGPKPGMSSPKATPVPVVPVTGACSLANSWEANVTLAQEKKRAYVPMVEVAVALKARCVSALMVKRVLEFVFSYQHPEVMAKILYNAGYDTRAIGLVLKDSYRVDIERAALALRSAGIVSPMERAQLLAVFNPGAETAARMFWKSHTYPTREAVHVLKVVFNLKPREFYAALRDAWAAGYSEAIYNDLIDEYILTARAFAGMHKAYGYGPETVVRFHKRKFNLSAVQSSGMLKEAGYAARDVAPALGATYQLANDAVKPILRSSGYTESEIASAFR